MQNRNLRKHKGKNKGKRNESSLVLEAGKT